MLDAIKAHLTDPAVRRARLAGRSYWSLLLRDGRVIYEWEVDWSLAPRRGRQSLRLYTPRGAVVQLDSPYRDGEFAQLKVAVASAGGQAGTLAHLVAVVTAPDGTASCAAYNYQTRHIDTFVDNVHQMRWHNLGALATDHLGLAPA